MKLDQMKQVLIEVVEDFFEEFIEKYILEYVVQIFYFVWILLKALIDIWFKFLWFDLLAVLFILFQMPNVYQEFVKMIRCLFQFDWIRFVLWNMNHKLANKHTVNLYSAMRRRRGVIPKQNSLLQLN